MNQTDYLALGMGGPTIFMEGTDAAANIRGFAVQAIKDCTFTKFQTNREAFVSQKGVVQPVVSAVSATDSIQVTGHGFKTGDRIVMKVLGPAVVLPASILNLYSRPEQIYYVIEGADANHFKLAFSRTNAFAGTQIALTSAGTNMSRCTVARVVDDNSFGHSKLTPDGLDTDPTFTLDNTAANERVVTSYVDGNTDMFDTGSEAVTLPKGMTIYVPVINIVMATGACIVYTRKGQ
tara:strand:- start:21992 stop:22696 length:705 start_codon:yes stop_codon:yes gene_type:complete